MLFVLLKKGERDGLIGESGFANMHTSTRKGDRHVWSRVKAETNGIHGNCYSGFSCSVQESHMFQKAAAGVRRDINHRNTGRHV